MSLAAAAFIVLVQAQDPDLGPETAAGAIGFAMKAPAGWKQVEAGPPAVFRMAAPEGKLAGGSLLVLRLTPDEPHLAKTLGAQNIEYLKRTFPGIEIVKEEEAKIAGLRGHRVQARTKENASWIHVIARSPTEIYMMDLSCLVKEEKAGEALVGKLLGSIRFFDPDETAQEKELAEATAKSLKDRKMPAACLGESYDIVFAADKVLGTIKSSLKEAQVAGRPGYEFESETRLVDSDGGRRIEVVKGSFLLDGTWQKQDGELTLEDKKNGTRKHRSIATVENGACKVTRSIKGEADDASFAVGAAAYLDSVADYARVAVAMGGKGKGALRVIPGFSNGWVPEIDDVNDPERMKVHGGERVVRLVLNTSRRFSNRTFLYEADGPPISVQATGIRIEIRRCTKADYEKVKQ